MKARNCGSLLNVTLVACLLVVGCFTARAQDAGRPLLLVASPTLQGPYRQTTLVAVPAGSRYAGFILNRATGIKLSALFPGRARRAKIADPVYFGGPEMSETLFALVRRDPGEQSRRLFGDVFVTSKAAHIDRIIAGTPNDARYFAGYVGWMPGELEKEIARGYWYVSEPDAGVVFRRDTIGMWEELVKRLGNGRAPPGGRGLIAGKAQAAPT